MKENEMLRQLKEQLQINLLQVFEDVNLSVEDNHSNAVRDKVLDHMCTVIINTVNEVPYG